MDDASEGINFAITLTTVQTTATKEIAHIHQVSFVHIQIQNVNVELHMTCSL